MNKHIESKLKEFDRKFTKTIYIKYVEGASMSPNMPKFGDTLFWEDKVWSEGEDPSDVKDWLEETLKATYQKGREDGAYGVTKYINPDDYSKELDNEVTQYLQGDKDGFKGFKNQELYGNEGNEDDITRAMVSETIGARIFSMMRLAPLS